MEKENQFEQTATNAEETLQKTGENIDTAMSHINAEKYDKMEEGILKKKTEEILAFISHCVGLRGLLSEEDFQKSFLPLENMFTEFPPALAPKLLAELIKKEHWQEGSHGENIAFFRMVWTVLQTCGYQYRHKILAELNEDSPFVPPEPLSFSFSENDFPSSPESFCSFLPKDVAVTFNGDVGWEAGEHLAGGIVTINGNAEGAAGNNMYSGVLHINGNTEDSPGSRMCGGILKISGTSGFQVGSQMKGGILDVGEVGNFSNYTFTSGYNMGTIIWKGETIWSKGKWTPEGKAMNDRGEIPIAR